jgi:hypothetical protein
MSLWMVGEKTMAMALVGIFSISTLMVNANASHSVDPDACYDDGHDAGQNYEFSSEFYDFCGPYGEDYYDGFIDGCLSVEGNSEEDCENAVD